MEYAILFSCMGVTIIYLLYKNLQLAKAVLMRNDLLDGLAAGKLEFKKTSKGIELIIKKEVAHDI